MFSPVFINLTSVNIKVKRLLLIENIWREKRVNYNYRCKNH